MSARPVEFYAGMTAPAWFRGMTGGKMIFPQQSRFLRFVIEDSRWRQKDYIRVR